MERRVGYQTTGSVSYIWVQYYSHKMFVMGVGELYITVKIFVMYLIYLVHNPA